MRLPVTAERHISTDIAQNDSLKLLYPIQVAQTVNWSNRSFLSSNIFLSASFDCLQQFNTNWDLFEMLEKIRWDIDRLHGFYMI